MGGRSIIFLALCLLPTTSTQCSAQTPGTGLPEMVVHVYDYAHVPAGILAKAQKEATGIFHKAGVGVSWLNCSPATTQAESPVACRSTPAHFVLNIHTRFAPGAGITEIAHTLGFVIPQAERVGVSYSSVKHLIRGRSDVDLPQILGHVMAHELGHLLLLQHCETGIMQSSWHARQLKQAGRGDLLFTPEQGERLRAQLLDSVKAQSDSLVALDSAQ